MVKQREFIQNKKQTMQKLKIAVEEGKVDSDIIPILDIINSYDNYYTSSSCYGRIVLLEIPEIGDKKNARWLGKWHHKINKKDIYESLKKAELGQIWILAQAPIIHIYSNTIQDADNIVKTAISCGFKNSGFKSISNNIVIEITSTERLDAPVGLNKKIFCDDDYLSFIVDIANTVFERSTKKLEKFKGKL